jgi:hypothetical protein
VQNLLAGEFTVTVTALSFFQKMNWPRVVTLHRMSSLLSEHQRIKYHGKFQKELRFKLPESRNCTVFVTNLGLVKDS